MEVPAAEPDCSDAQHKGRTPKGSPRTQESKLLATCLFHNPRNKCGKLVVCVYVHAFGVVVFVWGVCMFAIVCVSGAIPQEPFTLNFLCIHVCLHMHMCACMHIDTCVCAHKCMHGI